MSWLKVILIICTFSAFTALAPGCGDDDYNSDAGSVTHDLSAAVPDLAKPFSDGGAVDGGVDGQ